MILMLGLLILLWVAGCGRQEEPLPEDTVKPAPTPYGITYCDIQPGNLCLDGFGIENTEATEEAEETQDKENSKKMLILLKADDRRYTRIFGLMEYTEGEFFLECVQSGTFPENVYCRGEMVPEGEKIELFFYSTAKQNMIAKGAFIVHYGALEAPDVKFGVTPTATSTELAPAETGTQSSTPSATPAPDSAYPNPTPIPTVTTAPAYPN